MTLVKDRLLYVVLLASTALLSLTVIKPLAFDNALYQTMALDLLRYGKIPYLGSWDQNFPGIIYIHYLSIILFGTSDLSIRWLDLIIQIIFAGFLYRFWSRWLRPSTAALSAVLYTAYYVSGGPLLLAQRDIYSGMLIILTCYLLLRMRNSEKMAFWWCCLAGLSIGLGLVLRPTLVLQFGILLTSLFFLPSRPCKSLLALVFLFMFLMPLGIVLAYYASIPGGVGAFYTATIRWNLDLYTPLHNELYLLAEQFARRAFLVPFSIVALIWRRNWELFSVRSPDNWEKGIYIALCASLLLTALGMRKYFDYHFAPFFILLMPIPALGIEIVAERFRKPVSHFYALIGCVFFATFVTYIPKSPFAFGLALMNGYPPMTYTYASEFRNPYWGADAEYAVRSYLNRPENHEGSVEICSFTPNLQLHLDRERTGKYILMLPLAFRTNFDSDGSPAYTSYQRTWQHDYIDVLRVAKPRFIILARNASSFYLKDVYNDLLKYLPGFDSLLCTSYRYDTAFGGYQIFRLRSDSTNRN